MRWFYGYKLDKYDSATVRLIQVGIKITTTVLVVILLFSSFSSFHQLFPQCKALEDTSLC